MTTGELTPMFKQYQELKREYPDVILLFRCGDFYEMYGSDAVIGAECMDISLTERKVRGGKMKMAGVPFHALDRYLARLIAAGHKAAIAEQLEDPKTTKGLVKRDVIRILTPGTLIEGFLLDERANNYLISLSSGRERIGLAVTDCSTGAFLVTEFDDNDYKGVSEEIGRLNPSEIILTSELFCNEEFKSLIPENISVCNPEITTNSFDTDAELLKKQFKVSTLEGFGITDKSQAAVSAAFLLGYLQSTQKSTLGQICTMSSYSTSAIMQLDNFTRRNLELTESLRGGGKINSLLWVLDQTRTAMGARLLKQWISSPLLSIEEITWRLEKVAAFRVADLLRDDIRDRLKGIYDLERLLSRAATKNCNARDLAQLRDSLEALPEMFSILQNGGGGLPELVVDLPTMSDLADTLRVSIVDSPPVSIREGGMIRASYNPELDKLRDISKNGKSFIVELENRERERTGIKTLKVGYNSVFGYYIEVSRMNSSNVPDNYVRKQTLANNERFITPELKEFEELVLGAEDKIQSIEHGLFCELRDLVSALTGDIQRLAKAISTIDVLSNFAYVASKNNYNCPAVNTSTALEIINGRHPVVELTAENRFVPNNSLLSCDDDQLIILTGPNMAGKSTYLRQTALITLMAQIGSFVPAEAATIGLVDRIFTRVGASDDLATGQSTFMVEMTETANILNNATERSLVILDEIGRGTSTFDGLSIAFAVAEHLHEEIGCKTLFATHYHQLNQLEQTLKRAKNYRIAVKEDDSGITFLRRIVKGGTDKSYGIHVARLAGLPDEVLYRAERVLKSLEENDETAEKSRGLAAKNTTIPPPLPRTQLTLFEVKEHPVVEELLNIDLDDMTPREALNALARLQKKSKK